jgi:hypothetical protein
MNNKDIDIEAPSYPRIVSLPNKRDHANHEEHDPADVSFVLERNFGTD